MIVTIYSIMQLRSDVNHLRFVMVTLIYDYQSQLFSFKQLRDITAIISKCLKQNQNEIKRNNNATHMIEEKHSKQVSSVIDNCKGHTLYLSGYIPRWHYSGNSSMAMRYFRRDISRKKYSLQWLHNFKLKISTQMIFSTASRFWQ